MSKQVKVAIFAIITIVIFILGLNFLKGKGFFDNNTTYYAIFDEVAGMQAADPVVVNGYQVGKVGSRELINGGKYTGKILVELIIRNDIEVPVNSKAILFSADLLGEMNVKLLYSDTNVFHQPQDTISTKIEGTLFEEIGGEITPITEKLNLTIDNVNQLFDFEKKNVQSLNYTIQNLNETMATFRTTGAMINEQLTMQLETIDRILTNLEKTTKTINANEGNITETVDNVKELTANLKTVDIQKTLNGVDSAVTQLNAAVAKINSNDNSLGALLNERDLYDNLEQSSVNLELLLRDLQTNPQRYIHFSVFGGKNKGEGLTE